MAQATGPENIGPERTLPGLLALWPVNSLFRITIENKGKFRQQPDRENAFAGENGGEEGIRTLDTLPYTHFPGVRLRPLGHLSARGLGDPRRGVRHDGVF